METLGLLAKELSEISDKIYSIDYPEHHPRNVLVILKGTPKTKTMVSVSVYLEYCVLEDCRKYLEKKIAMWKDPEFLATVKQSLTIGGEL
jgi:hypothetical protein